MSNDLSYWWKTTTFSNVEILCQERLSTITEGIWSANDHVLKSELSIALLYLPLFLFVFQAICYLLKPLHIPNFTQIIAGTLLGALVGIIKEHYYTNTKVDIIPPPFIYITNILSNLGFFLHIFTLGVETNMNKLQLKGAKIYIIALTGIFLSLAFSIGTYYGFSPLTREALSVRGRYLLMIHGATNYLLIASSHLNDLGISNSKVGRTVVSTVIVVDVITTLSGNIYLNVIQPITMKQPLKLLLILYYIVLLFVCRPLIMYIVKLTPEGKAMKRHHFAFIIVMILLISLVSQIVDQTFSIFLLALTLPEQPLASILSEKLDAFVSGIMFPFFIGLRGLQMTTITKRDLQGPLEPILFMGYLGKFLGTYIPSILLGLSNEDAIILSLIMSARGLLDIVSLDGLINRGIIFDTEYTITMLHVLVTGVVLPLVRWFYKPSRQLSTALRHSILDLQNKGITILACIYEENNTSGILQLLRLCHPLQSCPNYSIFALQLFPLTGRCTLPIMGPLHQLSSMSFFQSNISRCNRVVNAFLNLERESNRKARTQHYIAMTSNDTMHDDICNLAQEKRASIIILPFQTSWAIRSVNKMVLEHAPCSVGILIDKSAAESKSENNNHLLSNDLNNVYHIAVIFIGGSDDYEAIAYSKLFATDPSVRLTVIHFRPPVGNENDSVDREVIKEFRKNCVDYDNICFKEVIVNDWSQTVEFIVSVKNDLNLVIVGKKHDEMSPPVFGLSQGWSEYSELGMIGDTLASSDFEFSLLVVQLEHD